jgi:phosphohistidine phosphatase
MAKQLIVVRHGKSDWAESGMSDFDRPLNHRGHKNAVEMAERMSRKSLIPALIVSSPAKRALTTAQHFSTVWNMPNQNIQREPSIYDENTTALLKVVNKLNNDYDRIALFGHNPGLTDFINYLANTHLYNLPTAAVAVIDFPFDDWLLVSKHTGNLFLFDFPKNEDDV